MRNPLSSRIVEIPFYGIRKFFDIAAEMKDVISLGVGEPDFDTPWHIRDEGIYSLEQGHTAYTSNAGLKELKIEIAKYLERIGDHATNIAKWVVLSVRPSEGFGA